jgi:phosphoribosylformimino-5-aminoimidazole carboxamide ribotide isomerase
MIVIPAIDLKGGRCVRLQQGKEHEETVYSEDPVAIALAWEESGAELIHLVDLDGAFTGEQKNLHAIKAVRGAVGVDLQLGGGIRDVETMDMLISLGINRVILGTLAAEDPELLERACKRHPGRIIVGIDAMEGKVAVRGWVEVTDFDATEFALSVESRGAAGIVYTDISRDGMLTGPNIPATGRMAEAVEIPVIASGGISTIEDIRNLLEIRGLWGAITGKALYAGTLRLKEAIGLTRAR